MLALRERGITAFRIDGLKVGFIIEKLLKVRA
jgi:hypothetical protein